MDQPRYDLPRDLSAHPSEMASRVAAVDWSKTALGPMEGWPQSLRIAVGICLNSRFPMFVWWGPDHINIYNDAYVPILGKRHPDALGRKAPDIWGEIWDVVGPQARLVMERGEATWNDRVLLVMERHGYTEDTWFTWSYSPIPDGAGGIGGVFCACTEETGRVIAERERDHLLERVENERARLAEAFERAPSFLAVLKGPQHVFEFANARYNELIAGRPLIGRSVRAALPEIGQQGFFEILDRVYATGVPFVGTGVRIMLQLQPDGPLAERFLDFVYQPMRDSSGAIEGILAHGVDVTEREIAASKFRQLADAMPQIVFAARADGHVDYFNRQWYEYTGLPEGEVGQDSWKQAHTPDGLRRVGEAWPKALQSGEPYEIEYQLRRHDGVYRWHLGRALPIRDSTGRIARWFGTNTDIDDRKRIEDALAKALASEQEARGEAELASRMKDEFLATLSHELRTPLNAILGWAHILRRPAATAKEIERGADVIERNARVQATIIEDLLDMSAIISGKARIELHDVDLPALVRSAVETARPSAEAKQVRIQVEVDSMRGAVVRGDPNRLQQVLWNLLSNAIKFTPANGRIQVALQRTDATHAEICVADSGKGIAPDFLPFVFDRFRQADASTTRSHGGLGLGLAIVKQLVELHGGTVHAQSLGEGKGATFIVRLPVGARPAPATSDVAFGPHASPAIALRPEDCAAVAGHNILVVDDEADARDLVRQLLQNCGASVTTAASGAEALAIALEQRFDVLVSDIGMPGQDGYSLIQALRARGADDNGAIPAIALTAYARSEDRVRAIQAGFQQHAAKPIEPGELLAMVASLVRH
jgi:PAS domain S-box-containing protein